MASNAYKWAHLPGPKLLSDWRARARRTQQEAANEIGCDLASYNAFENGRERPGLDYAVAIERVTGTVRPEHWTDADDRASA